MKSKAGKQGVLVEFFTLSVTGAENAKEIHDRRMIGRRTERAILPRVTKFHLELLRINNE